MKKIRKYSAKKYDVTGLFYTGTTEDFKIVVNWLISIRKKRKSTQWPLMAKDSVCLNTNSGLISFDIYNDQDSYIEVTPKSYLYLDINNKFSSLGVVDFNEHFFI